MRFHVGKVPPDPTFRPERDGWQKFREPNMLVLWLLAIPFSVVMFIGTFIAIGVVGDSSAKITVRPDVTAMQVTWFVLACVGIFVGVLIVHELIHLIAHPKFGFSNHSVLGIWPRAGVCYAYYGGELSRNRFLFIIALPLITLTGLPVVWFWATGKVTTWLAFAAMLNALGASFDVLVLVLVLYQAPAAAIIRNNGWDTYWKRPTGKSMDGTDLVGRHSP